MTDALYPSHPDLLGQDAGRKAEQAGRFNNPVPQAYPQPVPPQQHPYPMPHLPQSFQPTPVRHDIQPEQYITPVEQNVPTDEGKLLQNVTWQKPQQSVEYTSEQNQGLNPAYPPMPGMQAASNMVVGAIAGTTYAAPYGGGVDNLSANNEAVDDSAATPTSPKNLVSSVRQRIASKPKAEKIKAIKEKMNTDIVADPDKPRSARSIFLTGALSGAVIAFVLSTAIGNLAGQKEYATVAKPKAVTQPAVVSASTSAVPVEKLNDDIDGNLAAREKLKALTNASGSKADLQAGGVFLDEQLSPSQ